jgi:CCR4-NOT transcription complex subunit 1
MMSFQFPISINISFFVADIENRELASWRSLEVIDTLLVLAEGGHTHAVKELFAVPQAHCPGNFLKICFIN